MTPPAAPSLFSIRSMSTFPPSFVKTSAGFAAFLFAILSTVSSQGAVHTLVDSDPATLIANDGAASLTISSGETWYFGIPYDADSTWSYGESTGSMQVTSYFYSALGGLVAMNFYGDDSGTPAAVLVGFTTGTATVAADQGIADSAVTVLIGYEETAGNPFGSYAGSLLWLGITNTGASNLILHTGMWGWSPSPSYAFASPFDSTAESLNYESYSSTGGENAGLLPWLTIRTTSVPEPSIPLLGACAACGSLFRRRRAAHA